MIKAEEIKNQESCFNRAQNTEMLFVLLERDIASPETIRFWARERVRLGKNQYHDPQITEALQCADYIEQAQIAAGKR